MEKNSSPLTLHILYLQISCLLERLRGAACASEPRTQRAIYELGFSVMNPVLVLLAVYKDEVHKFMHAYWFHACMNTADFSTIGT